MQGRDDARGGPDPWAPPDTRPAPAPWGQQPWAQQPGTQQPWGQQPWGAAPPDPRAQRRRRTRAVLALGSVVALLVVLLGGAALVEDRRADRVQAEVDAALPELLAFVEAERGLPFREPVQVEVLDDDAFLSALYAEDPTAPEPRADRDADATLTALGLLEDDVELDEAVGESLDEGVVGFYDPTTGRLAVRGREFDALARLVLVHELTHALQDQHFDIERRDLDQTDDERSLAFLSLVEGDAVRVETAWLQDQPPEVQDELAELFGGGGSGGGEPVVEELLGFPYYAGPVLVESLLATGGQAALDRAFTRPPSTTEQVLLPGAETPGTISAPDAEGELVDTGVLGALGLALVLGVDPLEDGADLGWAGDRYVTTERDGVTCTTADIATDDTAEGAALRRDLEQWASGQPDATVTDGPFEAVRLRSCLS